MTIMDAFPAPYAEDDFTAPRRILLVLVSKYMGQTYRNPLRRGRYCPYPKSSYMLMVRPLRLLLGSSAH